MQAATAVFGAERAQSLDYRLNAENLYTDHALRKPLFGYGRWDPRNPGRPAWMVYNAETGKKEAVVDGMWLLTFAINGLAGVVTLTTAILLPTVLLRKPSWIGDTEPPFAWGGADGQERRRLLDRRAVRRGACRRGGGPTRWRRRRRRARSCWPCTWPTTCLTP